MDLKANIKKLINTLPYTLIGGETINKLYNIDCIEGMKKLEPDSVDAIVTDSPYGLNFMSNDWDNFDTNIRPSEEEELGGLDEYTNHTTHGTGLKTMKSFQQFSYQWAIEAFRVLKPGGHLLSFGGSRTFHRMTCGIEDAGFEIRDTLMWLYSTGMPKGLNISKAIDKKLGLEPTKLSPKNYTSPDFSDEQFIKQGSMMQTHHTAPRIQEYYTKPNSPEAQEWEGWNTSVKPAFEPILVARKPFKGSIVDNILKHGTGGLNIDDCRIPLNEEAPVTDSAKRIFKDDQYIDEKIYDTNTETSEKGRFPTNVILDKTSSKLLDEQTKHRYKEQVSRFFYTPKASYSEKNRGCSRLENKIGGGLNATVHGDSRTGKKTIQKNNHPTVKPTTLMEYLIKLVSKEGQLILDPFAGSGSTLIACKHTNRNYIGFEKDSEYYKIAKVRIKSTITINKWL